MPKSLDSGEMSSEMTKAVQRIEALCGSRIALQLARWLSIAEAWGNSAALFDRLAAAPDRASVLDHVATLRYALVFRGLGLLPSFEPTGPTGPDLLITRDGASATVEVTRFRPMNPGPPVSDGEFEILEEYGNPERDVNKSFNKVLDKFSQAIGPCAVIAVWNDDDALEEIEMSIALRDLRQDRRLPVGLQIVVYGSDWMRDQQLYCFPMKAQLDVHVQQWAHELETVSVSTAVAAALANVRSAV